MVSVKYFRALFFLVLFFVFESALTQGDLDYFKNRTFDGTYNDLANVEEGKSEIPLLRKGAAAYQEDGNTMLSGPNPREISNILCHLPEDHPNNYGMSSLVFTFLQFVDHDITFSEGGGEFSPIIVPRGDSLFDPMHSGMVMIPFSRSLPLQGTGTDAENPRQQTNGITAWMDASNVYGSDAERAQWLRSRECGKLKVHHSTHGDLLPCNTLTGDCNELPDESAPHIDMDKDHSGNLRLLFVAGDIRANEQPGLTALHTLFVREHNRICDELSTNGQCDDEANYQYARKMVNGILQSIFYNELAPMLGLNLGSSSYRRSLSPEIFNSFSTAAFRIGHTMISETIPVVEEDCGEAEKSMSLKEVFFNPSFVQENGIEGIFRGLSGQKQQKVDIGLESSIRNFLFGTPGAGGLDLAALNIQRGRDHGIPDFNTLRHQFGLKRFNDFDELTSKTELAEKLKKVYDNVDNIDAWVGMLAEDHASNSPFGKTIQKILSVQFGNIRRADRFYYTRDRFITRADRNDISRTTLADVVKRNTGINEIEKMFYQNLCTPSERIAYCEVKAHNSRYEWIDAVGINGKVNESSKESGYQDFSPIEMSIREGSNSIMLSSGSKYFPFKKLWKVWIDLDANGLFNDDELVLSEVSRNDISEIIRIQNTHDIKSTRMRVMMGLFRYDDPCHNIQYGEIEDYTVTFGSASDFTHLEVKSRTEESENLEELTIYPNPSSDRLMIKGIDVSQNGNLSIYNALGQMMVKKPISNSSHIVNVSDWPSGTYTVLLRYEEGEYRLERFVVGR